jgi:hypothetical protein
LYYYFARDDKLIEYQHIVAQNAIIMKKDIVKNKSNVFDNREDISLLPTDRQKLIVAASVHQQAGIDNGEDERSDL